MVNFNTDWLFLDKDIRGAERESFDEGEFSAVNLPHSNKNLTADG